MPNFASFLGMAFAAAFLNFVFVPPSRSSTSDEDDEEDDDEPNSDPDEESLAYGFFEWTRWM